MKERSEKRSECTLQIQEKKKEVIKIHMEEQ
jgi:hypothetical protein